MKNIVVWDSTWHPYFVLAESKGIDLFDGCEVIKNFTKPDYIEQDPRKKVVIINGFRSQFDLEPQDLSWADLVICWTPEILAIHYNTNCRLIQERYQVSNVVFLTGGQTHQAVGYPNNIAHSDCLFFLHAVADTNKNFSYNNDIDKPYLFDALLGSKKSFRKWIYFRLQESLLDSVSLVNLTTGPYDTYYNNFDGISPATPAPDFRSPQLDELDHEEYWFQYRVQRYNYVEQQQNFFYSGAPATNTFFCNNSYNASLSYIIPERVYTNSWYSIVSETLISNSKFITEKTGKCLLGGRIFVAFAPYKHLEFLRSAGFKTFDTIIDESYDQIEDSVERFRAAWSQVECLSRTDPKVVYAKARDILDHNHNLLLNLTYDLVNAKAWLQQHLNSL